jgi:hypothetical protein
MNCKQSENRVSTKAVGGVFSILFTALLKLIGQDKPKIKCPSYLKQKLDDCKNGSKHCIQSKGLGLPSDHKNLYVHIIAGTKVSSTQYGKIWQYVGKSGRYVGGECQGSNIWVAADPSTREVNDHILRHELGHWWLHHKSVYGHDPRFKDCFIYWADAAKRSEDFIEM